MGELIHSSVKREWAIFRCRKMIWIESIQHSNYMNCRPSWKFGTREIGLLEIHGTYLCIEIWKQTMTSFHIHYEYQSTTLNFPVALPLIRIVYWISYEVTFGDPASTCKKRTFFVKWNILKRKWSKANTDQWVKPLLHLKQKQRPGKMCSLSYVGQTGLNPWLENLCFEPKFNSLYEFFFTVVYSVMYSLTYSYSEPTVFQALC